MVMGGDSRSEGRGFESWRQILDGHFFTNICYKNLYCLFEKTKNKRKEAGVGPFFNMLSWNRGTKRRNKRKQMVYLKNKNNISEWQPDSRYL